MARSVVEWDIDGEVVKVIIEGKTKKAIDTVFELIDTVYAPPVSVGGKKLKKVKR